MVITKENYKTVVKMLIENELHLMREIININIIFYLLYRFLFINMFEQKNVLIFVKQKN